MVCLGIEPGEAGWKAQRTPLSYGGTPYLYLYVSLSLSLYLTILVSSLSCSFVLNHNSKKSQGIVYRLVPC